MLKLSPKALLELQKKLKPLPKTLPKLQRVPKPLPKVLELLPEVLEEMFGGGMPCDGSILTNARQYDACRRAYEAMLESLKGLKLGQTPDAVLTDVEAAMEAMGEVTGATVREDITARIFERFCVGK